MRFNLIITKSKLPPLLLTLSLTTGLAFAAESKQSEGPMIVQEAPLVSIATHDAFFNKIAAYCGQSFLPVK